MSGTNSTDQIGNATSYVVGRGLFSDAILMLFLLEVFFGLDAKKCSVWCSSSGGPP